MSTGKNKRYLLLLGAMLLPGLLMATMLYSSAESQAINELKPTKTTVAQQHVIKDFNQLAQRFEQNQGQSSDDVQFISRGAGYALYVTGNETVLSLSKQGETNHIVRMRLAGESAESLKFEGREPLSGKVNYLHTPDKSQWITDVPNFSEIYAKQVYPGIDLRYHGDQHQLEYDFVVAPGADAESIKLAFEGVDTLDIDDHGNLILGLDKKHQLVHKRPVVYQEINDKRVPVEAQYTLSNEKEKPATSAKVGFQVAAYDADYPLVIDPIVDYATYFGAEDIDRGLAVTIDKEGNIYVAGTTESAILPVLNPLLVDLVGSRSTFIAKLNPAGDQLIYSTYLGGSGSEGDNATENNNLDNDLGVDIAVDEDGYLYVAGGTNSTDFPVINALQSIYGGGNTDVYLSKLSQDGSDLEFSTFLGGDSQDYALGLTRDDNNQIYLTGLTRSPNFPVVNAIQPTLAGDSDAFLAKLDSSGQSLVFSTFIGGTSSDIASSIDITADGKPVITGSTRSANDFPLNNALQASFGGGSTDSFITQLASDGQAYNFSTFIGGSGGDEAYDIALNRSDEINIVGRTSSTDFPMVNGLQSSFGGGSDDGFISQLATDGSSILFSSYWGGSNNDTLHAVTTDLHDEIYIIGSSKSDNLPTVNAVQSLPSGNQYEVITAKLIDDGSSIVYSTYLGGSKPDYGYEIAVDDEGNAYSVGVTQSNADFPIINAIQPQFGGVKDSFIVKIADDIVNAEPVITSTPEQTLYTGEAYSYDIEATDDDGDTLVYSLAQSPEGMTIDEESGLIHWTTAIATDVDVTVSVDDGFGGVVEQSFTIDVINSNTAPQITSTPVTSVLVLHPYQYAVEAEDIDGDVLNYNLTVSPVGMTIEENTGVINWTPDTIGEFNVVVSVSDGQGGRASQSYTLTVNPDTAAPVITITSPTNGSVTTQSSQTITGTLDESATFTIDGNPVTLNADYSFSYGSITLGEGLNLFSLEATDLSGNTATSTLSVRLDTQAPELTVTVPQDGKLVNASPVTVSGHVSEQVNLNINGQTVTQEADFSFNTEVSLNEGENAITITATDFVGLTDSQALNVTLDSTAPSAPKLSLINRSNPQNGIIQVMGQADSVEPGTLVHVVNPNTGFEATDLAQSDGSFTTSVSGFANDNFTLFTVDAAGNTSPSVTLTPSQTLALTLDPIGDKVAPLGQITRFTVTAHNSDGDDITLGLTPLPLPQGMAFNIQTGAFSFAPDNGQEGDYELTFSAQSGDEYVTETMTVTVPAANPADPTVLTGRILDANSMQEATIVPMVGVTVSFLGTGVSTTTDAEGYFTLSGLPETAEVFDIDSSPAQPGPDGVGYAGYRTTYHLVSNVVNQVERPFYMPRLNSDSATTVDPTQTVEVENTTIGVKLTIDAGTAIRDDNGELFTGDVTISEVPRHLAPGNLPPFMDPNLLFTVQPVGVSYTTPRPITLQNTEGYAPDSEVDIWSVDPDLGQFVKVGVGKVTADGSQIETIDGGLRANDWHATLPPETPATSNSQNQENNCDDCQNESGASMFNLASGHMSNSFSLPSYRSLEQSHSVRFSYQSNRAYPRPIIDFTGEVSVRSTVPDTVSYQLEVAGLQQGQEVFIDTSSFSEGLDEPFHNAISYDASDFATGLYDYRLKVTANFSGGTRMSSFVEGQTLVKNETQSAFGTGWMLEGLYHLAFNADASISTVAPSGRTVTYRPSETDADVFTAPLNDYATFIRNTDGSYTHTSKAGIKKHFNTQGLISSRVDRNGNTTAYTYDDEGKLETVTDAVGLVTTFAYDNNGYLASVTDPAERVSTFEYDAVGNLIQVTYPDDTFETFEYDERHLMTAHQDELQNRYEDTYDVFGRIVEGTLPDGTIIKTTGQLTVGMVDVSSGIGSQESPAPVVRPTEALGEYTDGRGNASRKQLDQHNRTTLEVDELGRQTSHIRDENSNATQTTRSNGSVVTRTFDDFGNVLTQTEQFNGATTTYTYDSFNQVTSVTNPNNHTTTINRDPTTGNPLATINALGHTTAMEYDGLGLMIKTTSLNGLVTEYSYNEQGLMATKTETPPEGSPGNIRVTSYSYYPTGLLQTVTTPDGLTLNYNYDARGMLTEVTDNLNQSVQYIYDAHKNIIKTETSSSDGSLATLVENVYDNRNRLTLVSSPHLGTENSVTERVLDENSNLASIIDPNGNSSTNLYDAFNRLESNTHREGGITQYEYDDQDRIIKVTAPNGVVTEYEYDLISRRIKEISQDRGTVTYSYDLANNVTSITEGRGITSTMAYDELERLTSKTYPNTIAGKTEDVTYSYDTCTFGVGMLCSRSDDSGSYQYSYDAYGNLTQSQFTEISGISYTTSYAYDDSDNLTQMTSPSGRTVDYTRDEIRRLSGISTTLNGSAQTIVSNMQYRGDGQVTQSTFGNGLIDSRNYDLQGRLTDQLLQTASNQLIDQRVYSYDKNGNILNIDTNNEDNNYNYDKLDRLLTDKINTDSPYQYSYDLNNNRAAKAFADAGLSETYEYVAGSNRLLLQDAVQTGTEALPVIANRELVYNDAGRLFQLYEEGTLKAEYIYNDNGLRTRKTLYQSDGVTVDSITVYLYDQSGSLITETTETGELIKDYIWNSLNPVAQIDGNTGSEQISYLHVDHLMTARLATDSFQNIIWKWEGEAFGNSQPEELASIKVNLRFPGQYFDAETKLHYNHFRYYDPEVGSYITSDPIGLGGGFNTYAYAYQNPNNYFDPDGQLVCFGVCTAGAVFAISQGCRWLLIKVIEASAGTLIAYEILSSGETGECDNGSCPTDPAENDATTPPWMTSDNVEGDASGDSDGDSGAEGDVPPGPDHPYNPGKPTAEDGFVPPKNGDGNKTKKDGQYGWTDKKGRHWVPTNPGNAHGGPHWDVQLPGGGYINVKPKR